jgi:hypothetical protein
MDNLNLPEFLSLFGCTSVDDCWLNADCVIDESGIKTRHIAKHSDEDYIDRTKYSQRVELRFPCTEQQLYDWAHGLDDHESFYVKLTRFCFFESFPHGYRIYIKRHLFNWSHCVDKRKAVSFHIRPDKHHHFVERLPKEIVDKWQPVNELYRGWCYARGDIKEKIGTEPFNVNWNYWLSLPEWDKKQAALLISGLEPDKFHLIENLADYKGMCEPLVKLLRKIPDDLVQCPLDWLNWFDEIGNLMYARKPLRVWFGQQSGIVALQAEAGEYDDTGSQRQSELHHFIWRVRLSLIGRKKRYTWLDVWREIENNHTQHDKDDIIEEVKDGVIFWCSSGGTEQKLKKTILCKTITGLKKKPPF